MKTSDFFYDLPKELIAQTPIPERTHSRLLVLDRFTGAIEHRHFYEIGNYLNEGDLLVLNDSKVIPARIFGLRAKSGISVEFLLLRRISEYRWECLVKPGRRCKIGDSFDFSGLMSAKIEAIIDDGIRIVEFSCANDIYEVLDRIGNMPLPPYITEKLNDKNRYQTVYAKNLGSAAAPTAGLHFTESLLSEIRAKGVEVRFVTLHVGLGTFRPVKVEDVTKHKMHSEYFFVPDEVAQAVNRAKNEKRRVIAVGTTACRTLEAAGQSGVLQSGGGNTEIFIYPGYRFKITDALITNFHLPESTLLMLVSALAGKDHIFEAYRSAIALKYRFFSFGDAMFIK